ncbi:MAG: O-antigen ligase family protein [Lysobacter sp.]
MLRLMLALTIILTPNLLYFPPNAGLPGLNPANLLLILLLATLTFTKRWDGPPVASGVLTPPLLFWFLTLVIAFFVAQATMPINLLGDLVHLKNIVFYPLLYFVFRRCRQDLNGTRQLIYLTMAVAVAAGVDAAIDGLKFDINSYSDEQRTAGPFGERNASNRAGVFYAMFLPLLFAMAIFLRGKAWWRLAAIAGCVILAFAIMVTFSRQSYLIALVGIALLLIRRHMILAVFIAVLAIPATALLPTAVVDRVAATQRYDAVGAAQLDDSTESRFTIWAGAWKMWKEHPAGVGLHRFPQYIGNYSEHQARDAHSIFVLMLAECGVLGWGAVLWLLWRLLRLAQTVRLSAGEADVEAKALGIGFTIAILSMALGNVYGTPFLDGLVMGNFWILCGLLEHYALLKRHAAVDASPAPETPFELARSWQIGERFPLASRVSPGRYQSAPK